MVFTIHSLFEYILAKSLLKVVNLRGPDWQSNTSNGVLHVIYTWRNMELICFVFQIIKSVKEEVEVCNNATCSSLSSSKYFIAIAINSFCQIGQERKVEAKKLDSQSQLQTKTITSKESKFKGSSASRH